MSITIKAKRPLSEAELLSVEAAMRVSIPEGYRAFLLATDGGRPVEDMFLDRVGVRDFLGASDMAETRSRLRGRLPETLLPIAIDSFGNYICISTAASDSGAIHFWDHELEHLGERAIARLASSFDEFASQLRVPPPVVLAPASVISVEVDPEFLKWAREQERLLDERPTLRWPASDQPTD